MWCIVSGSWSSARYRPGGFWSRTAPRMSSRSSARRYARTRYSRSWRTSSPSGSGGRIGVGAEHGPCRTRRGAALSTRGTVTRMRPPFALHGRHVELVPLAREHVDELAAAAAGDRSTLRLHRGAGRTRSTPPTTSTACSPSATPDAAVPFAQRRTADGRLVGCTRFMELRWWRGPRRTRRGRDRRHVAGRRRPAHARSTPRPSCCCSPTPSSVWGVVAGGAGHRRPQRAQPAGHRAHRRPLRGHAAPPPPVARAGRGRSAAGHGAVRHHRRRLAARPRQAWRGAWHRIRSPT